MAGPQVRHFFHPAGMKEQACQLFTKKSASVAVSYLYFRAKLRVDGNFFIVSHVYYVYLSIETLK
jgi:hypothetical protein